MGLRSGDPPGQLSLLDALYALCDEFAKMGVLADVGTINDGVVVTCEGRAFSDRYGWLMLHIGTLDLD